MPTNNLPEYVEDHVLTVSCGNIFADLGFDPVEAEIMALRTKIMIELEKALQANHWTQHQAAQALGVTQSRISDLKRGKAKNFSIDMLLTLAARAGLHPNVQFSPLAA
jgi:predicted XRE-type DNA-binding protein